MLLDPSLVTEALAYPERVITVSSKRKLVACPRRFRYEHSQSHVDDDSLSLRIGTRWHSVLESLYQEREHPENHVTLRHFVQGWDDLRPLFTPEQPFLFPWKDYLIGGVIDLVVKDVANKGWALDHKISTGQFMSHQPPIQITEQLGVYTAALRYYGHDVQGGILSRVKVTKDTAGELAHGLLLGEGGIAFEEMPMTFGFKRVEAGHTTLAVLHDEKTTLRVEREFFPILPTQSEAILDDLVYAWKQNYTESYRVPGSACLYCPYLPTCLTDRERNTSAPEIDLDRLHPEFTRRIRGLEV